MISKGKTQKKWRRSAARAALALTALAAGLGMSVPTASALGLHDASLSFTDPTTGSPVRQAGSHPDIKVVFDVEEMAKASESDPVKLAELPHHFQIDLPPGVVANATNLAHCPVTGLKAGANGNSAVCPIESQMGVVNVVGVTFLPSPIYNVVPPKGTPAMFAFNLLGSVVRLTPSVRAGDYGITMDSGLISQGLIIKTVETTFWGVPADGVHDAQRQAIVLGNPKLGFPSPEQPPLPLNSLPTSCPADPVSGLVRLDGWQSIGQFAERTLAADPDGEPFKLTGCDQLDFKPSLEARPTTNLADSPSGLDVSIKVPTNEDPNGSSAAQLRDVTMTLPAGMTINPSSANGLGACSPSEIGLETPIGQALPRFNGQGARCPDASKLGTVRIDTPLLEHPMPGEIYLAEQNQNPFNSLLALYIVIDDPESGTLIKLAGQPIPDPVSGQLTVSFAHNPQLPFEEFRVNLFTGPRAALKTPVSCGEFTTNATMVPWTAPQAPNATPTDAFLIEKGANEGPCLNADTEGPNAPVLSTGTVDPAAGAYSPFVLKLSREDGTQPIKAIDATLPKGLLGKLAGVPYCPAAALSAAAGKSGRAEQASSSCAAASQVGSVTVAAGAGSDPFYAAGKAYLAGPYKGAPLSLAIITPAVAGPFDLGNVVVRTALNIDPETTQIHAVSDEIPTILQGIPLDVRSIALNMDRPSFTLNPTSCNPTAVLAGVTSVFGQAASLTNPFQVGGCNGLGFKPKLSLALKGGTERGKYPALRAQLNARPGDANIAKAVVSLPHSEFLAQEHIRTVCTRVQFAANACPAGSIYGKATAWSPLLDAPLSGPVYLRSSSNKLPDLVADLNGQIRVSLVGRIDSIRGGIRNSFELVPDAPVSKFVLQMQGGKKGLLVNSRNLCKSVNKAQVSFDAQNGKVADSRPALTNSCKAEKSSKRKGHARRAPKG